MSRERKLGVYKDENIKLKFHNKINGTDDLLVGLTDVIFRIYEVDKITVLQTNTMLLNPTTISHYGVHVILDIPIDSLPFGEYWYDVQYVITGTSEPKYVKGGMLIKSLKLDNC